MKWNFNEGREEEEAKVGALLTAGSLERLTVTGADQAISSILHYYIPPIGTDGPSQMNLRRVGYIVCVCVLMHISKS